jgi:hypothetical protein
MAHKIETREQKVIKPLLEFFSKETNFKIFLDIVVFKTHNMPLRLLDWFVTNYAKKNDVCYNIKRPNGNIENFCVFRSYRAQLKGCKKKEFDPFCRGDTITLEYEAPKEPSSPDDETKPVSFETAVCQLKFFKWAIENLILTYVDAHFDEIYADMKANSSKSQKIAASDEASQKRKKNELSKSIFQQIHVSNQNVTFSFPKNQQITCIN